MNAADSFTSLLALHAELDNLFAEHQFALLHFDFDRALGKLRDYERRLLAHMVDEEEFLIPIYAERGEIPRAGAPKLFLDDHEKMRAHVSLFIETTESLQDEKEPEALVIRLLDREAFFKRLCGHHDIREREILYPVLDAVTDATERAALIEQSMEAAAVARGSSG
jgi:hypothetical protein